jgi:hypothetical protein
MRSGERNRQKVVWTVHELIPHNGAFERKLFVLSQCLETFSKKIASTCSWSQSRVVGTAFESNMSKFDTLLKCNLST